MTSAAATVGSTLTVGSTITGPTASFSSLLVSGQSTFGSTLTGPTGSFQSLVVAGTGRFNAVTGATASFTSLALGSSLSLPSLTGATGSFQDLIVANTTSLSSLRMNDATCGNIYLRANQDGNHYIAYNASYDSPYISGYGAATAFYHVSSGAYCGKFSAGGLTLPTTWGTPSTLAGYMEAYSHSSNWNWQPNTGSGTTVVSSFTHKISRIGKTVTLQLAQHNTTTPVSIGGSTGGYWYLQTVLPSWAWPVNNQTLFTCTAYYGSSSTTALVQILSTGNVQVGLQGSNPLQNINVSSTWDLWSCAFTYLST